MEAGLEVYQNNILVWSDDHFGEETTKGVYLIDINTWDHGKDGNVFKPIRWQNMRNGNIIEIIEGKPISIFSHQLPLDFPDAQLQYQISHSIAS